MITAIINARCGSSRLPLKHFEKIGNRTVIENIINTLKKNKFIDEIYIATGSYKKNKKFRLELKKRYKNLKFFFYNKENNVTERIYKLSKKIKNKFTVSISGDCVLIDNNFIERLYKKILKNNNYDFIIPGKKVQHEGIKLFRTKAWSKVNKLSNNKILQENPGYIIKLKPKKFNILKLEPQKYELGKKSRLSIDAKSDLDFFKIIYQYLKLKKKKFTFKNASRYNCFVKFNYINNHVKQKKPNEKSSKKFYLVTSANKYLGLGHYKRIKIIEREIRERFTSNVQIILLDSPRKSKIDNYLYISSKQFNNLKYNKINDYFIFDLTTEYLKNLSKKILNIRNLIFIDKYLDIRNSLKIIPAISLHSNLKKRLYAGKRCLILNREIINQNQLNKFQSFELKKEYLTIGGTGFINSEILNLANRKNLSLILSNLVNQKTIKYFIKAGFKKIIFNPKDIFKLFSQSKKIYCRFGVTTFELIGLNKVPYVLHNCENNERLKEINYLKKKKMINCNSKFQSKKNKILINKNLDYIFSIIEKFVYG
jgi:spore coat polysaccharide biosynthesis protein SpsF